MTCSIFSVYIFLFCLCLMMVHEHYVSGKSKKGSTLELFAPIQQKDIVGVQVDRPHEMMDYTFSVKIGIGTTTSQSKKPYKEYSLHVDTSIPLSWLQCQGCTRCFDQTLKPFPKSSSKSFHPILDSDKQLCLTNQTATDGGTYCPYRVPYGAKSFTEGFLAKEDLFLCSSSSSANKNATSSCTNIGNLSFGCGMNQKNMFFGIISPNMFAGVLGLGWGPLSFVRQIDSISDGKFSHCFPPSNNSPKRRPLGKRKTRLRFGVDAVPRKKDQTISTKLEMIGNSPFYYVELLGISFNGRRLSKIKESVFRVKKTKTKNGIKAVGGVILNTGRESTKIFGPAYDELVLRFKSHFVWKLMYKEIVEADGQRCYKKPRNIKNHVVPSVTFHFKGADLVLKADALMEGLYDYEDTICLGMKANKKDNTTFIGAHQMVNQWITYDTKNNLLSFHPEDCNKNG